MKRIILLLAIVITGAVQTVRAQDVALKTTCSRTVFSTRISDWKSAGSQVDAGRLGAVQRVDALAPAPLETLGRAARGSLLVL